MVFVVCLLKTNCQHNNISLDAISDELQNRTEDCRIEAFQCSKWRVPANSAMEDTEGDGDVILAPHTIPSSDRNRSRWWWERKARVLSKDAAEGFGARWDAAEKRWYVPEGTPLENFARWLPDGVHIVKDASELTPAKRPRPVRLQILMQQSDKNLFIIAFIE